MRFIEDKPAIYFYADRQLVGDHLRAFAEQVFALVDDPVLFSKSGFTPRVEAARTPYVLWLALDDLFA